VQHVASFTLPYRQQWQVWLEAWREHNSRGSL
jgi:hypothetical protein